MKVSAALLSVAVALGVAACGGSPPPSTTSAGGNNTMQGGSGSTLAINSHAASGGRAGRLEGDPPPEGAQFTLFCDAIRGQDHVMTATAIKDKLMGKDGLRNWHILHTDDQSTLFYGYYRTFDDVQHEPAESARAQSDLHAIEAMKNAEGDRLFQHAIFLPINAPDPDAPPQWNLAALPASAYWSLQIGAYQGGPDRKRYALDAVRGLRTQGIEAYYFHGETISSVCVGAWPIDAVKRQESSEAGTADPNKIPIVVDQPLPPNVSPDIVDREGNHLQIQAPKLEVLDGSLAKAIRDYPEHAVNGEVMVKTAKNGQKVPSASFLVLVPHDNTPQPPLIPLSSPSVTASSGADEAASAILEDGSRAKTGYGQLRSVDGR